LYFKKVSSWNQDHPAKMLLNFRPNFFSFLMFGSPKPPTTTKPAISKSSNASASSGFEAMGIKELPIR